MKTCSLCGALNPAELGRCMQCGAALGGSPAESASPTPSPEVSDAPRGRRARFGGRYVLKGQLGSGHLGAVHKAEDTRTGDLVALKVLHPDVARALGRQVIDGARQLTQLHHLKLCRVLESNEGEGGSVYVASELLDAVTLASALERHGPIPAARLAGLMVQVCSALSPLHQMGRAHGNLTPENIFLLAQEGPGDFVKVADAAPDTVLSAGRVKDRLTLANPRYFSPEQAGDAQVGPASDQFSIGIILCQMLTGEPPFTALEEEALVTALRNGTPPPVFVRKMAFGAGPELESLIDRCLDPDPEARFPNVRELARGLSAIRAAAPEVTPHPLADTPSSGAPKQPLPPAPPPGPPPPSTPPPSTLLPPTPAPASKPATSGLIEPGWLKASLKSTSADNALGARLTPEDSPSPSPFVEDSLESLFSDIPGDSVHDMSARELLEGGSADDSFVGPMPVMVTGTHDSADLAAAIAAVTAEPPPPEPLIDDDDEDEDVTRTMSASEVDLENLLADDDALFSDVASSSAPPPPPRHQHRPTAPVNPQQVAEAIARADARTAQPSAGPGQAEVSEESLDPASILSAIDEELSASEGLGAAPLTHGLAPLVTAPAEPAPEPEPEPEPTPAAQTKPAPSNRQRQLLIALVGVLVVALSAGIVFWAPWESGKKPGKRQNAIRSGASKGAKTKGDKGPARKGPARKGPARKGPARKGTAKKTAESGAPEKGTPDKAGASVKAADPQIGKSDGAKEPSPATPDPKKSGGDVPAQKDPTANESDPPKTDPSPPDGPAAFKPAIVKGTEKMLQEEELGRELDVPMTFRLVTDPGGAEVWQGESKLGVTPFERTLTREGVQIFEIRRDGYLPATHRVDPLKAEITPGVIIIRQVVLESVAPIVPPKVEDPPPERRPNRARRRTRTRPARRGSSKPTPAPTGDLDNPYDD